jgi:DNA-binding beta-propeller fold protein YncE
MSFERARDLRLWIALATIAVLFALLVVPALPREVQAGRGDGQIVVADLRDQAVLVIDGQTGDIAMRIAVAGGPHELLRLPDGRILASLEQAGALALLNLDGGDVETIELGGTPHGLALDGETLLVTDRATSQIRRFALPGWTELAPIETGVWPHAVTPLPDGRLAVAEAGPSTLSIGTEAIAVSELPETVVLDPSGTLIATAGALGGDLQLFDAGGGLLLEVALGGRPVRVLFSPDGGAVAVALSAAHEVALVALDGNVRRVPVSGVPDGLAFSSDGARLYASDVYGGALTVIDPVAGVVTATFFVGESTGALLVLQ